MAANFNLEFDWEEESDDNNDNDTNRFGNSSKKDQENLLEDRHRDNTRRATRNAVKILIDYLKEKKLKKLEELTDTEFPDILLDFYSNLRKVKGGSYKLQTLKCIRAGLNRFTKEHRNLDIIADTRFARTNEMFKAVTTKAKRDGLGSTRSTPPVEEQDMAKCAQHFCHNWMNEPNPRLLQQCVLFNMIYFFCRRGRQNIYDFTIEHFKVHVDASGKRYVYQAIDELDKNHNADENDPANDGFMYEQPGKHFVFVPVKTKLYHNFCYLRQHETWSLKT